jgi:hypothetical protein
LLDYTNPANGSVKIPVVLVIEIVIAGLDHLEDPLVETFFGGTDDRRLVFFLTVSADFDSVPA